MAYGSWKNCQAMEYAEYPLAPGRGRVGQDLDHQVGHRLGDHVHRHPAGHPAHLGHFAGPEGQGGLPPEAGRAQRREQGHGLRYDAERGADAQQLDGAGRDVPRLPAQVVDGHVQPADDDHDQVVDHRGPHRRGEPAAGVEDRSDERAHPVEEDLRDEEVGPQHHQVVLGGQVAARRAVDGGRVQRDQRRGQGRGHHRDAQQGHRAQGEHPLGIGLAAVRVAPGRPDQQRYHHAGEDAAQHQVVDRVRQRVGVVVRVAERGGADRVGQHQGAQEAGASGGQGADGHAHAGADQAGALGGAGAGRPRRPRATGPARPSLGARGGRIGTGGRLRVPGPQILGRAAVRPRHATPAGRRVHRAVRPGRGEPRRPGRGRPLQRQRQRRLGRARAAARHRAVQRRQRVGRRCVPAAPRGRRIRPSWSVGSRLGRPRFGPPQLGLSELGLSQLGLGPVV